MTEIGPALTRLRGRSTAGRRRGMAKRKTEGGKLKEKKTKQKRNLKRKTDSDRRWEPKKEKKQNQNDRIAHLLILT